MIFIIQISFVQFFSGRKVRKKHYRWNFKIYKLEFYAKEFI